MTLDEMETSHKSNLMRWLVRHANIIEINYTLEEFDFLSKPIGYEVENDGKPNYDKPVNGWPRGEMATDMFERELDNRMHDPVAWIKSTPFYQYLQSDVDSGIIIRRKEA